MSTAHNLVAKMSTITLLLPAAAPQEILFEVPEAWTQPAGKNPFDDVVTGEAMRARTGRS